MKTTKENKLKLRENEVVHAETFELAAKVCKLADKLGLTWRNNISYIRNLNWQHYTNKTCYNLNVGEYADIKYNQTEGKTTISATEWLNRHGIFIFGQKVLVRQTGQHEKDWNPRIFLHNNICVSQSHESTFKNGGGYRTTNFDCIKSTFPKWEEKEGVFIFGGEEYIVPEKYTKDIIFFIKKHF